MQGEPATAQWFLVIVFGGLTVIVYWLIAKLIIVPIIKFIF